MVEESLPGRGWQRAPPANDLGLGSFRKRCLLVTDRGCAGGEDGWRLGIDDEASVGPVQDGQPARLADLRHGMSWEELLTNPAERPMCGAYCIARPWKVAGQSGGPARAVAFVPHEELA